MLKLAFRNIFRHRVRTLLTLGAVVFGVAAIILSGGFVEDIFLQIREATIHSRIGHLQVYKAGYSSLGRRDPYAYLIAAPEKLAARAATQPEVRDVMMRLNFSGLASNGRADLPIIGEGVEPGKEARLGTFVTITEGRLLNDNDSFGILLGKGVARALGMKPGDFITLLTTTPDGALNTLEFDVVGIFQSFSKEFDDRAVRIPLAAAQELLTTEEVHSLVLLLAKTDLTDHVARNLRRELPVEEYEVHTWYDLADFYQKTVGLYRRQYGILQFIILIMVMLGVANSVNMAIHERTGEFGTLLALGDKGRGVFKLVLTENTLLGIIGAAVGVAFGTLLAWGISSIGIPMPPPPGSNSGYTAFVRIVPSVLLTAFLIGTVATVLAAILPARRVGRLPVIEALRQND